MFVGYKPMEYLELVLGDKANSLASVKSKIEREFTKIDFNDHYAIRKNDVSVDENMYSLQVSTLILYYMFSLANVFFISFSIYTDDCIQYCGQSIQSESTKSLREIEELVDSSSSSSSSSDDDFFVATKKKSNNKAILDLSSSEDESEPRPHKKQKGICNVSGGGGKVRTGNVSGVSKAVLDLAIAQGKMQYRQEKAGINSGALEVPDVKITVEYGDKPVNGVLGHYNDIRNRWNKQLHNFKHVVEMLGGPPRKTPSNDDPEFTKLEKEL